MKHFLIAVMALCASTASAQTTVDSRALVCDPLSALLNSPTSFGVGRATIVKACGSFEKGVENFTRANLDTLRKLNGVQALGLMLHANVSFFLPKDTTPPVIVPVIVPVVDSSPKPVARSNARYLSPSGSDANTGQDAAHPWKTFAKAFGSSGIGAGGELILLDGTYSDATGTGYISYLGTNSAQAPSGKGRTAALQTYVHALNPGNVIVGAASGDALFVGRSTRKDSCITFEGIRFEGSVSLYNTLWITLRNSGVHDEAQNGGSVFAMGTNDGAWGNSYNLIEDTWIWGKNRALAITYRSDHNVWRRVVLRGDGCNSAACSGSGNPNVGITTYESTFTEFQNVFVVDRVLGGGEGYADFATAQHTGGQSHGGNRWRGSASLQSEDNAIDFEWDAANTFPVVDLADFVAWSNVSGAARAGVNITGRGGKPDVAIANITVYESSGSDLVRLAPNTTGSLKGVIAYGSAGRGINSAIAPTNVDLFGTFSSAAYNQTSCSVGCKTTNPTADGSPASLQYPLRIEAGSALAGGSYGATIVNQFGVTGTHWGEVGYDALTAAPLWPWPTQATMKAQMCATVTRGFCSAPSFTEYVWGLLGHASPF